MDVSSDRPPPPAPMPLPEAASLAAGTRVADYRLIERAGAGAVGAGDPAARGTPPPP